MPIKVYIASITGNTEIRKQVQRVLMVLDGLGVEYEAVDITLPGKEEEREFMRSHGKPRENHSVALPPQIFCNDDYIGDYSAFDNAVEDNQLLSFLRLQLPSTAKPAPTVSQANGSAASEHDVEDEQQEDVEGEQAEEPGEEEVEDGDELEDEEEVEEDEDGGTAETANKADEQAEVAQEEDAKEGDEEGEDEEGEENADEEEEEDVEDVEIEDEEEAGDAVGIHCAISAADCGHVLSRHPPY